VIPTSANAVICEVHRTWNRPDAAQLAELYAMVSPNYRAVMESYQKAQTGCHVANSRLLTLYGDPDEIDT
jgi:hypothetical protein